MIHTDVLIIGGGASGIYCAWRLSKEYGSKVKIILAEKCSFLGGRLQSVPFGNKEIYAEVGGMRTFPTVDKILAKVLKELNIQTIQEPYNDPVNIAYVKNKRFSYGVIGSPCSNTIERKALISAYNLPPREWNQSVPVLITNVADEVDPNFINNPVSVYKYPQLNRTIFVDLLKKNHISEGAIEAFRDFSGYDFSTDYPIASSVAIREDFVISGQADQFFIVGGYNSFVYKMAKEAVNYNKNFQLMLSTYLKKIKPKNGNFVCDFGGKETNKILTASVILAIPKKKLIDVCAPWTNNALKAFSSIFTWVAFKAFLKVDKKTYNILSHDGTLVGRNISDLPARQIWFYSANPPCLLVYCDGQDANYWKKYTNKIDDEFCTFPKWHNADYNVSLTQELIRQISIVFGVNTSVINVKKILYKYWDDGAYFWKPSDIPSLSVEVREPLGKNRKTYIVGSDFSLYQGWVEGALQSADDILVEKYFLKPFINK